MADSRDTIRKEVENLLEEGTSHLKFSENKKLVPVNPIGYQTWYTKAHAVVRQLIPARLREFEELYKIEKRNPKTIDCTN